MAGPFPILFITANRIGDAVLSSGLLKKLHEEIPNARFTIAAGPLAAPLFRDVPGLDRVIAMPKRKFGLHWYDLWRLTRGRRWGFVLDMRGSGLSRFLSARKRAVRHPPPVGAPPMHKVIEAARLLKLEDDPPPPFLFTGPETEAAADALLHPQGGTNTGPILAMGPAANWVGKTWPAERFAVAAAELLGPQGPLRNGRLLILGGEDDRWAAEVVRRVIPRERLIDAVGRADLLVGYAMLKRARLFIGNDSGLMHLAAAAGIPTLGLFGPSDERLYGPWGPLSRAVRGPRDFDSFRQIDPELSQAVCHMQDLSIARVVTAARELLLATDRLYGPDGARLGPETTPTMEDKPDDRDL
jgi:ADP-heptose:LPS heptosyltransferase